MKKLNKKSVLSMILAGSLVVGLTRVGFVSYASDNTSTQKKQEMVDQSNAAISKLKSETVDQTKDEEDANCTWPNLKKIVSEDGTEEEIPYDELMSKYVEMCLRVNYYDKTFTTYEENSDVMYKKMAKMQKKIDKLEAELNNKKEAESKIVYLDPYDVRVKSGATVEQLNAMLKGTWLEGYGEVYHRYEEEYGINAIFSIGNAILETGWDINESYLGTTHNNIYGISVDTYFASKEDCIDFWYKLISEHYIGEERYSMWNINSKYCPPNNLWTDCIISVAHRLTSMAGLTLE